FAWGDGAWRGLPLDEYIIYELHVGTFTAEGTFDAIIPRLDSLRELGVTAIELMPVAQFPGERNWGYDGAYPYAVQESYGGIGGLKRLVDACHARGLAVILDVVYNHLGPEGNYASLYGPYFTPRYATPWGSAINFDGAGSDEVRAFFLGNALRWIEEFHIDALRLDAVHAILDWSARPFLQELGDEVRALAERLGRNVYLIAESDLNDPRVVRPAESGGYGMDAQWSDDFHHALHTLLTGEGGGYYADFLPDPAAPSLAPLARAWREGFVYGGEYSPGRQRRHGLPSRDVPAAKLVICAQNHDQIGNRMLGERLGALVSFEQQKLAAAMVLLSPFIPLLFMGEEYGETAPFLYFISHGDPDLVAAVRAGRREEFAAFAWQGEPPDPAAPATFQASKLNHDLCQQEPHRTLRAWYRELIRLRTSHPALRLLSKEQMDVWGFETQRALLVQRRAGAARIALCCNFGAAETALSLPLERGPWRLLLNSAAAAWRGPGASPPDLLAVEPSTMLALPAHSCLLYAKED
ncbi:MAG TPA: malto-oligosyltrehalose trehalohydrolase, partial [Herpetosiphonaceae bacterium]